MLTRIFLAAVVAAAGLARADVTMRQTMRSQTNVALPGVAAGAMPAAGRPTEIMVRIKGSRAYSSYGPVAAITDAAQKQITLLDPANQRFATTTVADYLERLKKLATGGQTPIPEAARQMMAGAQVRVDSHETGRSEQILGIQARSSEIDMSMTFPMPMGGLGRGGGLDLNGKFECWKPAPGEAQRIPGLRELMGWFTMAEAQGMGPAAMLDRMFGQMPGMGGSQAGALATEMAKGGSLMLRMHGSFFMPALAAIMEQAKANGANLPNMPGIDKPMFEITSELVDLNFDPVPDTILQVPEGYREAPVDELIKLLPLAGARR